MSDGPAVRLAGPDDGPALAAIYAPFVVDTAVSFELDPPSAEQMASRVAATQPARPWLVAEVDGRVAGFTYAARHRSRPAYRWSVDVSVYVAPADQRRGLGRRLYTVLFDLLARQGYRRAFAGITLPNEASVGLHRALGFEPVGTERDVGHKLGRWHDVSWWQRTLGSGGPDAGSPGGIRPLDQIDLRTVEGLSGQPAAGSDVRATRTWATASDAANSTQS